MGKYKKDNLDLIFFALGHHTRRRMISKLVKRSYCVTELAEPFDLSLKVVSSHIKVLERAGLVERAKQGRVHGLTFKKQPLDEAIKWIKRHQKFWDEKLDSLEEYIRKLK